MTPTTERPLVVIAGGGITGLSAAWELLQAPEPERPRVVVVEAGHFGGKVRTEEVGGVAVDSGPDAFLARRPEATELATELGLGDELVAPATGKAYVWTRRRLYPLPEGLVLGAPTQLRSLARSGLLSPAGRARAALDLVLPRSSLAGDPSVGALVGARFGRQVVDRLVDPLVGGIHAGPADRLSVAAVAPQLLAAAGARRSLLAGLRIQPVPDDAAPVFLGFERGMERLVDRLVAALRERGARLLEGTAAEELRRDENDEASWRLRTGSESVRAGAVVVTLPAFGAAPLLRAVAPAAASELEAVDYASVALGLLAFRAKDVPPLDGSGCLVPSVDGRLITACSWASSKWAHLGRSGLALFRVSAGRWGDDRIDDLDDDYLLRRMRAELSAAVGLSAEPVDARLVRWPRSFPQYHVGHLDRVARIEAALAGLPGLEVAGAAYRGLGLPACVAQGRAAARRVLAHLAMKGA